MISLSLSQHDDLVTPEKSTEQLETSTPIHDHRMIGSLSGSPRKLKINNESCISEFESHFSSRTTTAESTPKIDHRNIYSNNPKPRLVLPIYVYDCSLSLLIEVLVDKAQSSRVKDTYEDHTFGLGEQVREEYIKLNSGCDTKPTSPEPKSEDSDNLSNGKNLFIFLLHYPCPFLFSSLKLICNQCCKSSVFIQININVF